MNMISIEKSEILGLLCAEGYYNSSTVTYLEYDKRRKKTYKRTKKLNIIEFTNKNKFLLSHFQKLINKEYDYTVNITDTGSCLRIRISKNNIVNDLISYTNFNSEDWKVPKTIINGSDDIKIAFIRGFYEGDGIKSDRILQTLRVRICSKNLKGLKQLEKILKSLDIESHIYNESNKRIFYTLNMFGKNSLKFLNIIKPQFKDVKPAEIA